MSRSRFVVVEPAHETPLVTFHIATSAGAVLDPPGCSGFTNHTTELARRGAAGQSREQLDATLDGLGASVDFSCGKDYATLNGVCLTRNLDAAFDVACDVLTRPDFTATEHDKLLSESRYDLDELRDDDRLLVERYFARHCVPGHPYARSVLGTRQSLDQISLADIPAAYRRLVCRESLSIAFSGAIDESHAHRLCERLWARLPSESPTEVPGVVPKAPSTRRLLLVDKPDRKQTQVLIGHDSPSYGTREFTALMAAETAFGGMFSSRLMQEIRVARGWSYGTSMRFLSGRLPAWFRIALAPSADVAPDALALTLKLFAELVEDGLSTDELALARSHLIGANAFLGSTARRRATIALREHCLGLPAGFSATLPDRLAAVSDDQVNQTMRDLLDPGRLCTVVVATARTSASGLQAAAASELEIVPFESY